MKCTLNVKTLDMSIGLMTPMSKLGFLEKWHKQEFDRTLLAIFKQRIYHQAKQNIYANIENSRKCSF